MPETNGVEARLRNLERSDEKQWHEIEKASDEIGQVQVALAQIPGSRAEAIRLAVEAHKAEDPYKTWREGVSQWIEKTDGRLLRFERLSAAIATVWTILQFLGWARILEKIQLHP